MQGVEHAAIGAAKPQRNKPEHAIQTQRLPKEVLDTLVNTVGIFVLHITITILKH